jgi:hypothetical protein
MSKNEKTKSMDFNGNCCEPEKMKEMMQKCCQNDESTDDCCNQDSKDCC